MAYREAGPGEGLTSAMEMSIVRSVPGITLGKISKSKKEEKSEAICLR